VRHYNFGHKVVQPGGKSLATSLSCAMNDLVLPNAFRLKKDDHFDRSYATPEAQAAVALYRAPLSRLYSQACDTLKKSINCAKWVDFIKAYGLIGHGLTMSYALTIMVQTMKDSAHRVVMYEGFVEAVARCAIYLYGDRTEEIMLFKEPMRHLMETLVYKTEEKGQIDNKSVMPWHH
ncbi:hypothetical protein CYMTET_50209, partial [Cymbomonas tetramitiformis]